MSKKTNKKKSGEDKLNFAVILGESFGGIAIGIILCIIKINNQWGDILNSLGQLTISISAGSLLLEWFGYVNYTKRRMCEILCENEVLNVLSKERKKKLKTAILENLYMPNKHLEQNNIVSIIDNELDNILKDYYYDEYIMYVDINIEEHNGKKYIKKMIRKTYCAETINNQKCNIQGILGSEINPVMDKNTITLNSLKINGNEINNVEIKIKDNTKDQANHYDKYFYVDTEDIKDLLMFDDKIFIDMTYTTYTDINDTIFSQQIDKPCKHYCIHFNYTDDIKLDLVGFGFMTSGDDEKRRIVKTTNGHMLRFLSWILPGDGVMAALTITKSNMGTHENQK